jgi:type I restriction enzyme S subunit
MAVKNRYKQTEVGVIPEDWTISSVGNEFTIQLGKMLDSEKNIGVPKPFLGNRCVQWGRFDLSDLGTIKLTSSDLKRFRLQDGDLLVCEGGEIGRAAIWRSEIDECYFQKALHRLQPKKSYVVRFMLYILEHLSAIGFLSNYVTQTSIAHLPKDKFETVPVPLPPLCEQEAIAGALSDADAWIESLEQLIAKKRQIKQGAMQELLTGKRRLPGFSGKWETKALSGITDSLDNLRVPLNESQREKMKGDYPYCGANGVLGFVNKYIIDDEIILIAEDGGYFDEYETRPIAYRMMGKCWVNNHAHILKAKIGFDQGFIFFSLVHKNILPYLASGTRAKLNKSEMNKIEVSIPKNQSEQAAIATVLSDMDTEIESLESKLAKAREVKQGMMQELLTGRIRLV